MVSDTPEDVGKARLPPGLDLLWGRRRPSSRGPRSRLDVDQIVAAAIEIANSDGLQAVSMARVAKAVGVTTMALYRHVPNKDGLLQLMWNASAHGAEDAVIEGSTWRERLLNWAMIQRRVIGENPWIVQMPMATPPLAPNSLAWVELGLDALVETPLDDAAKMRVLGLISQHALIAARFEFDEERGRQADPAGSTDYLALVRELADEATFPHLYRLARTAGAAQAGGDHETEFRFDVELILDGVEAMIGRARQPQSETEE